ncbi:regulatory protein MsaA [Staphylococcus warneri]|uniref:regulatory protein MsaA n=1 Tax=Staphylococcus warneri TaxID=1292 RepID=UPI0011A21ACE|nr:regulatory protein MsaA [Staphylococcus warneri]MCG7306240.1 regulatory protein MsaA [Staphylococcus warneri]
MWTVAKIRADYEGWWLFEDWPEKIVKQSEFSTYEDMLDAYCKLIKDCNDYYDNCVMGKYNMYAFHNNCDLNFCEDCDEDLQIFYSFIVLKNNEVYYNLPKIV